MASLTLEAMTIRSIDPMSLAKIYAVLYGIMSLLVALPMGCASMFLPADEFGFAIGSWGLATILVYPIFGAIMGFIGGLLTAVIYNLVAGWVGGVRIGVEENSPVTPFE